MPPSHNTIVQDVLPPDGAEDEEQYDPSEKFYEINLKVGDAPNGLDFRFVGAEIVHVYEGKFADEIGVHVDDEIWSIDGERFMNIGGRVEVTPRDGQKTRQMKSADNACGETPPEQLAEQVKWLKKRPIKMVIKRPKYKDQYFTCDFNDRKIGVKYLENVITTVHDGEWADRNGVKPGDILLQVAGQNFAKMSAAEVVQTIRSSPKPVKMHFKRPAESLRNMEFLASDKNFSLNLKEDPNDPTADVYELEVEQRGHLGMRWVGTYYSIKDNYCP